MTRRIFGPGLAVALSMGALTACGSAELVVIAALGDGTDPNARLLDALEVQLLPYDRDAVFDSLAAAASRPEPEIPADLLATQEEIAQARQAWSAADARWGVLRESVDSLSRQLEQMDRNTRDYQDLYNLWEDDNDELARVQRDRDTYFVQFTGLQEEAIGRMDSVRAVRADWADEAFMDVDAVVVARIEMSGLNIAVDTTDATGGIRIEVAPGDYWVHARYELVSEELYWNVPITVARGEPMEVRLSRENAEVRPIF